MGQIGRSSTHRARRGLNKALVVATVAALGLGASAAGAAAERPSHLGNDRGGGNYTLTILHTNDLESALLGVDPEGDSDGTVDAPYGSAARHATLWDRLRLEAMLGVDIPWPANPKAADARAAELAAEHSDAIGPMSRRGVLSVSSGDAFLAGPQFDASLERGVPFYDAIAQQRLRLDAAALGNHEFDFGPEVLADFLASFGPREQFVAANLDFSGEPELQAYVDSGQIAASTVVRTLGQRIGVIGIDTPDLPSLSSPRDVEVLDNLAEIVNAEVDELEAKGVNKIVLTSHLQNVNNELELVPELRGVDVVIAGGGGEILASAGDPLIPGDERYDDYPLWAADSEGVDVPVVTVTGNYKYIGKLAVEFDRAGNLVGVDDEASLPVRVSGVGADAVPKDRFTQKHVEEPVAAHVESMAEDVVATSEVGLDGVRQNVRTVETNLGNLLADAVVWSGSQHAAEYGVPEPVVGIQNGGGIRNDSVLPPGDLTALDTYGVAPFANFVTVLPEVPRDTFRQLLERGVADAPQAAGAFIQISGARFTYDPSRTAQVIDPNSGEILTPGERVRSVELDDGTVVVEDGEVVDGAAIPLATQDFSANGGDGYPLGHLESVSVGVPYQQALQSYLADGLSGQVSAADYPEGGEGRITVVE